MRRSLQTFQLGTKASKNSLASLPLYAFLCRQHFSAVFTASHPSFLDASWDHHAIETNLPAKYKLRQLANSLLFKSPRPSTVWGNYMELVSLMNYEALPLEIHQSVLRKCTYSTTEIRVLTAKKLQERSMSHRQPFHIHEARFQTVIRNIRSGNNVPALDDYHFILQHFAAMGHYLGMQVVLAELMKLGLNPNRKTYGLCLQALAHRLVLPYPEVDRPALVSHISSICTDIISAMTDRHIPVTSVNLDLAIRVLRESRDEEGLAQLLKAGYGIDLVYLDQPLLEDTSVALNEVVTENVPEQSSTQRLFRPFSTAALNVVVDILGRKGRLSRMVSFFETITTPIPHINPKDNEPSSFADDEDEDDHPIQHTRTAWTPPHAVPNTTTYNMLIKHTTKYKNIVLARHYVEQAMKTELFSRLQIGVEWVLGKEDIDARRVSVTKRTLLPCFGMANRDNNVELLRWIRWRCKSALRRKKRELKFFCRGQESQVAVDAADTSDQVSDGVESKDSPTTLEPVAPVVDNKPDASSSILDVDLDSPADLTPHPRPIFNPDLHVKILARDIEGLVQLLVRVGDTLHRIIQRKKQRLGRRVWAKKDIYLTTERKRVQVSKEKWVEMVNFVTDKSSQRK